MEIEKQKVINLISHANPPSIEIDYDMVNTANNQHTTARTTESAERERESERYSIHRSNRI